VDWHERHEEGKHPDADVDVAYLAGGDAAPVAERPREGQVAVYADDEQSQDGDCAEHDVTGDVDVTEDLTKAPSIDGVDGAEGEDEAAEE